MLGLTNDQIHRVAPSVFAMEPWEAMSDKYRFIPTVEVLEAMRKNDLVPTRAMQSRTRIPGKGDFTKHLIRFRHVRDLERHTSEELPEIVLVNSHDGTSAYKLMAGIFRLVCSNGMIVQSADMGSISVRHNGRNDLVSEVIEGSYQIIEDTPKIAAQIENYKQITLEAPQQQIFAKAAIEIKGENAAKTFDANQLLRARRFEDYSNRETGKRDLWRTMNVVQENLIRGGVRGRSASGRHATSRAVGSVTEDVRINRALWTLTEGMAKLAA